MTHRSPPPRARARRRGELTRISSEASTHVLSAGLFRGRVVGSLDAFVLEDQLDALKRALEEPLAEPVRKALEADQRAINEERERRWLAFTS